MVAEFESDLIRLRTVEGMKVAKAEGQLKGKQPKLSRKQEAHLVSLVHSGEYSTLEVAELFGVGRSTASRAAASAFCATDGATSKVLLAAALESGNGRTRRPPEGRED